MGMLNLEKNVNNFESFNSLDEKIKNINNGKGDEVKEENPIKDVDLVFLLDKSGSMVDIVSDTIGAYNSFIKREREKNPKTHVTLVLFDTEYKILYTNKPITEVEKLTNEEYYASGCTALLDAIGTTIQRIDRQVNNDVLFVITTDGLENSSMEFSKTDIKNMIANHNWEFLFIGADIDSYAEANALGIDESRTANYDKSSSGLVALFDSVGTAHEKITHSVLLDDGDWKKGLD